MQKIKCFYKSIKYSLKLMYTSSKLLMIPFFLLNILLSTIPLVNFYLLNVILNFLASEEANVRKVFAVILIYILMILIEQSINSLSNIMYHTLFDKACHQYDLELFDKLKDLPLSFIDSSKGKDLIDDVRYTRNTAAILPYRVIRIFTLLYSFLVAFISLIKFNLWFSIIYLLLTIPGIIINKVSDKKIEELRIRSAPDVRKFSYYRWMLTDSWPAKDVRMYDLTENLKKRYINEKQKYCNENIKLEVKKLKGSLGAELIKRTGEIIFTIYVIYEALHGNITIGNVALYIGLSKTATESFQTMTETIVITFDRTLNSMSRLFEFNNIKCDEDVKSNRHLDVFESLTFSNVSFKYPFADKYVLNGVSFTLNKGDKLSIIGINGAGKSTIVKLMLGLYKIDSGLILINGHPMEEYNTKDARRLFSVLFQSFVSYPFTLRQNIALSDLTRMDQDDEIVDCIKQSGIYENYNKFNNGLDSFMTRDFDDNGVELSKGQWQKVALSRTYFKKAPIIIFDEPSSALDAETEDKIFKNFESISKDKTAIMISHRISSAKMSNKIIVLNNGTIEESGTHEELINYDGLYAKLYNLQMKKYVVRKGEY